MSEFAFGTYPEGRRLEAPSSPQPFGNVLLAATPDVLHWARENLEEIQPEDLDFGRSSRKIFDRGSEQYWRLYTGQPQQALDAGVSAYCIRDSKVLWLRRPNSEKVQTQTIGKALHGRMLGPNKPLGTGSWH